MTLTLLLSIAYWLDEGKAVSRDRGSIDEAEAEARQLRIIQRRGWGKAVRKPYKCIKLNLRGNTHTEHV